MRDPDDVLTARLRFRHLELIQSLCATGSLHKTARAMHLSQPAISKALGEIESSFGFRLFARSPAGVAVTARGQTVLEGATLLLNGLRHVRRSALHAERRLVIRVGVAPFLSVTLVPNLLRTLRKHGDDAVVSLYEGRGPHMFEMFKKGELDAVLVSVPSHLTRSDPAVAMTMIPMFEERLAVVAGVDHPLARRRRVSWLDLLEERWIIPQPPSAIEEAIRSAFVSQGLVPPRPCIESMHPLTNIELVAAGHGIAAVPSSLVRAARERRLVLELRVEPKGRRTPFSFIFRSTETDSPAILALRKALEARGLL